MEGAGSWICQAPALDSLLVDSCWHKALVSAVHLLFVAILLALVIYRVASSKVRSSQNLLRIKTKVGALYVVSLIISTLLTLIHSGLLIYSSYAQLSGSAYVSTVDIIFSSCQTIKWLVFLLVLGHEKRYGAEFHPITIRIWWLVDLLLCLLLSFNAAGGFPSSSSVYETVVNIIVFISLPASLYFFYLGVKGSTGITTTITELQEPLLKNGASDDHGSPDSVTGYATSSVFSRAFWKWLTPLLEKGYQSQLQLNDIPQLAVEDRVETNYARFKKEWPETPGPHPVRTTLLKCFGGKLLRNGLLAFIRLCVMYAGPVLIQRFVDFTSGKSGGSSNEGYYLVLVLLVAKFVEVLSSHQYNFQSQRLGMVVRSTVIAAVYQKGLRLSSSSKQSHGVGPIVNYMVVDAQQLSDLIFQLHNLWILPAQVCVALAILYGALGLPMLAGFLVMVLVIAFNFHCTQRQKQYQLELMSKRDDRMKATSEVLNFMKIIKFQAWEDHFLKRVEGYRNTESEFLRKFLVVLGENITSLWICGSLVAVVTFSTCIIFGFELTAGKIFTATATFRVLQEPVRVFPQALISLSQSLVSLQRLDKFMVSDELDTGAVDVLPGSSETAVEVEQGSFSWEEDHSPTLKNISFHVRKGQLVTIVGTVGSGKSSMLTALLGEMKKLSGKVRVCGSTAYVPQTAWVQNGTIEDNILFGLPMDKSRYAAVIRSCALEEDLKIMEFGDQTEIGERGINLSGGQKQRIQLARAVYQDTDVYLLDDVFSAVDAHTGTHLFQECIRGILKGKTILLVTHQVEFLHGADLILVMRDGVIVQSGDYTELMQEGADLEALVAAHHSAMDSISIDDRQKLDDAGESAKLTEDIQPEKRALSLQRRLSNQKRSKGSAKLIDEEQRQLGRVGRRVYWLYYTRAFGWPTIPVLISFQAIWTIVTVIADYWLADESASIDYKPTRFILVYLALSFVSWVLIAGRVIVQTVTGLRTAQLFYFDMLRSIFRSPMSFFDTTPSGRILSRASTDQATLDVFLPFFSGGVVAALLGTVMVMFVACQVTWPLVFLVVPLLWIFARYQNYFITTSRELTRLDSISKAPVIFHFSETLAGLATIRAFKKQASFTSLNVDRVNTNIRMDFHNNAANEWLGLRLEMIGTVVLCASALLLVTLPTNLIQPEKVGLSLSYGLSLNAVLFWTVWLICMLENKMVSVERIRQYTTIESEAERIIDDYRPPAKWPSEGRIVVQDLQLRYRPNTPLVLKGVSVTIEGGSKVGVVGRTGSGKSTLMQAFFRLVEPCGGRIIIDNIEITKLGLADLRSRFGIIPQEPILFEGSVRSNVDPLGQYSDDRIWEVLRKCQLAEVVQQKSGGLDSAVLDNGENWSVGQKQLFCLGRALLKESRVLFLDEATASVDAQTDGVIQKTIREEFAFSTVISVAHRIPSVMDSDKVLVMGEGEVKEYDRPAVLLERPSSLFGALVREYTSRSGV